MSSIVCQGLKSCIEPRFVEQRTLGLKLTQPKSLIPQTLEWVNPSSNSIVVDLDSNTTHEVIQNIVVMDDNKNGDNNSTTTNVDEDDDDDNGGWDFIQSLNTTPKSFLKTEMKETPPYVHPLVKRYSSKLSEKSLELCTENLGCETGSDIGENSDVYSNSSYSDSEGGKSPTRDRLKFSRHSLSVNNKKFHSFPPPLTSISGSSSVQVRPHRENGRLVMKTVVVPSTQPCFQAERSNGRLRLHFVNNYPSSSTTSTDHDSSEETQVEEEEEEEEEIYNSINNKQEQEDESSEEQEQVEQVEEGEGESDVETEPEAEYYYNNYQNHEDIDGNLYNGGVDMGREKFQRPSRCKEGGRGGNNGLLIWEPFWVST